MLFNSVIAAAILAFTAAAAPTNSSAPENSPSSTASAPTVSLSPDAVKDILLAPLAQDRINLLKDNANFVFDFDASSLKNKGGDGGDLAAANRKNFPALIGSGSGMAVGFLKGCGFNTPHVHPRATELQIIVEGTVVTEMVPENGVMDPKDPKQRRVIKNTLTPFQMTPFYQGSVHTQFNPNCEPAVFIASFNAEDFGAGQVLDETFSFDSNIVSAAFGQAIDGKQVDQFKGKIPTSIAKGVEECLMKCNIKK